MEHSNEIHAIASAVAGVLRQERLGLQKALEMIRAPNRCHWRYRFQWLYLWWMKAEI